MASDPAGALGSMEWRGAAQLSRSTVSIYYQLSRGGASAATASRLQGALRVLEPRGLLSQLPGWGLPAAGRWALCGAIVPSKEQPKGIEYANLILINLRGRRAVRPFLTRSRTESGRAQ